MKNTPENNAKQQVKDAIKASGLPTKIVWNSGNPYGERTVDATGVINGWPVAIEVKRFDGKGTTYAWQTSFLFDWAKGGGVAFMVQDEASLKFFADWLRDHPTPAL